MFAAAEFAERKPKYPDTISVPAPRGLRALVKQVAKEQGLTASEFVRSALTEKLAATRKAAAR